MGSLGILLSGGGLGAVAALDESNSDQETAKDSTTTPIAKSRTASGTRDISQSSTGPQGGLSSEQSQLAEPEAAAFQIEELHAPSTVEIGTEYTVNVVVKNTGVADGVYESEVTVDPEIGTNETVSIDLSIPSGETRTFRLTDTIQSLSSIGYEIGQYRTEVSGIKRTEPVGTPVTSQGVRITVSDLSEEGSTYGEHESENGKFIVGEITTKNINEDSEMRYLPSYLSFKLFDSQRTNQYEPASLGIEFDRYETANVRPGVQRSGPIVFDVPENIKLADLTIFYHSNYPPVTIEWHTS